MTVHCAFYWKAYTADFVHGLQVHWDVLIERGEVTVEGLLEKQRQHEGRALRLTLHPAARCGPPQVSALPIRPGSSPSPIMV